jgi:hypothetical protein
MNKNSENGHRSRKIGRFLFIEILAFHALICYAMGIASLISPKSTFETGFLVTP